MADTAIHEGPNVYRDCAILQIILGGLITFFSFVSGYFWTLLPESLLFLPNSICIWADTPCIEQFSFGEESSVNNFLMKGGKLLPAEQEGGKPLANILLSTLVR